METNTQQVVTDEQGIVSKVGGWLWSNWAYIAGAVVVAGGGYAAYRYFGAELEDASAELDRVVNE